MSWHNFISKSDEWLIQALQTARTAEERRALVFPEDGDWLVARRAAAIFFPKLRIIKECLPIDEWLDFLKAEVGEVQFFKSALLEPFSFFFEGLSLPTLRELVNACTSVSVQALARVLTICRQLGLGTYQAVVTPEVLRMLIQIPTVVVMSHFMLDALPEVRKRLWAMPSIFPPAVSMLALASRQAVWLRICLQDLSDEELKILLHKEDRTFFHRVFRNPSPTLAEKMCEQIWFQRLSPECAQAYLFESAPPQGAFMQKHMVHFGLGSSHALDAWLKLPYCLQRDYAKQYLEGSGAVLLPPQARQVLSVLSSRRTKDYRLVIENLEALWRTSPSLFNSLRKHFIYPTLADLVEDVTRWPSQSVKENEEDFQRILGLFHQQDLQKHPKICAEYTRLLGIYLNYLGRDHPHFFRRQKELEHYQYYLLYMLGDLPELTGQDETTMLLEAHIQARQFFPGRASRMLTSRQKKEGVHSDVQAVAPFRQYAHTRRRRPASGPLAMDLRPRRRGRAY